MGEGDTGGKREARLATLAIAPLDASVLDGIYRRTEREPDFREARAPTRAELESLLEKIIARLL